MLVFAYLPTVSWGGPIKIINQEAHELIQRGYDISICATSRLSKTDSLSYRSTLREVDGIRVGYLRTYLYSRWPGTTGPTMLAPDGLKLLWQEVKSTDLVHAHGTRNAIVLTAALFSNWLGKPFILQPHGTLPHIVASIRLKMVFDRLFMRSLLNRQGR